jgi:hypothetical protein
MKWSLYISIEIPSELLDANSGDLSRPLSDSILLQADSELGGELPSKATGPACFRPPAFSSSFLCTHLQTSENIATLLSIFRALFATVGFSCEGGIDSCSHYLLVGGFLPPRPQLGGDTPLRFSPQPTNLTPFLSAIAIISTRTERVK